MYEIGQKRASEGWLLRSGAADGADTAFESGCDSVLRVIMAYTQKGGDKEIFLPWPNFNAVSPQRIGMDVSPLHHIHPNAFVLAEELHPAWGSCSKGARKLLARNCHQILGPDLDDPVDEVICWTPGATETHGGTSLGIRLARRHGIPVRNLANEEKVGVLEFN